MSICKLKLNDFIVLIGTKEFECVVRLEIPKHMPQFYLFWFMVDILNVFYDVFIQLSSWRKTQFFSRLSTTSLIIA